MKSIKPLEIWNNGNVLTAICIKLYLSYDDLATMAALHYSLCDIDDMTIYEGQVLITDSAYTSWGASGDSNNEAYIIAAAQLNLELV
jgi:hypothetical protein